MMLLLVLVVGAAGCLARLSRGLVGLPDGVVRPALVLVPAAHVSVDACFGSMCCGCVACTSRVNV